MLDSTSKSVLLDVLLVFLQIAATKSLLATPYLYATVKLPCVPGGPERKERYYGLRLQSLYI
ncbi:hypothetical protein IQ07DRAFT_583586, partial [Pyrenochaeta sp. DS3sAY3a]